MRHIFNIFFIFCLLVPQVAEAGTKFPKTFWIGIDDGRPSAQSFAQHYLIEPVLKKINLGGENNGWALKPLVDQFFKEHPEDKKMLNLCESLKGISLLKDGTALGVFHLGNVRHFELKYEGKKDVVVEMSLSWIVIGSEKGATRIGVAPEVRLARTAFAYLTETVEESYSPDLTAFYQKAFFKVMGLLMNEVRNSNLVESKNKQIPVMIEKMVLGQKARKLVNEYISVWFESEGEAVARQKFIEGLKFYLQKELIQAIRKNPALDKVSLLPPKGALSFLQRNWEDYLYRLESLGYTDESRLPEPIIKEVGYACEYNKREKLSGPGHMSGKLGAYIVRGIWIQAGITDLDKTLDETETDEARVWRYSSTAMAFSVVPLSKKKEGGKLGLPDIAKACKAQSSKAVSVKTYLEAKDHPTVDYKAERWKLLRSIHNSISNPTPLPGEMQGIVQDIVKKLEQSIKIENWDKKIIPRLESVQCD